MAWRLDFPERCNHGPTGEVIIRPITVDGIRDEPAYIENLSGAVELASVGVWANVEELMEEIGAGGTPRI